MSGTLLALGALSILTPGILAITSGATTEHELIDWLIQQPLQRLLTMRAMLLSGVVFVVAGLGWR